MHILATWVATLTAFFGWCAWQVMYGHGLCQLFAISVITGALVTQMGVTMTRRK